MDDRSWLTLTVALAVLNLCTACVLWFQLAPSDNRLKRFLIRLTGHGGEKVSEEEIMQMVDAGEELGAIQQEEREMIENIFELNDTTAADVMVHRTDMVLLDREAAPEEILAAIESTGLSRFPVYGEDPDDIVGILNVRDYLLNTQRPDPRPLGELLREPYFIPETVRTDALFRDMQERKVHMAIVVDEYGGTAGLVTMEDLLEEIVGKIYDEFDPADEQEIIPLGENTWRVAGGVELEELEEALDMTFPESEDADYDTLGGLIFAHLDVIPEDGSQLDLELDGLAIHVDSIADRRVEWCTLTKLAPDPMDVLAPGESKEKTE